MSLTSQLVGRKHPAIASGTQRLVNGQRHGVAEPRHVPVDEHKGRQATIRGTEFVTAVVVRSDEKCFHDIFVVVCTVTDDRRIKNSLRREALS